MKNRCSIGLVGDYNPEVVAHRAIPIAFEFASQSVGCDLDFNWLHTSELNYKDIAADISRFDGIWVVPNCPYASTDAALAAIRYARESDTPFLGTCGGFQHALMEIARDVLSYKDAEHAEINPDAKFQLITLLSCTLVEKSGEINIVKGTMLHRLYGAASAFEGYHCRYGLNPKYESILGDAGVVISARDDSGDVRAIELPSNKFFVGTLFQPERSALEGKLHPLIRAFIAASCGESSSYRR